MCGRFVLQTPAETLQRLFGFVAPGPSPEPARTDRPRYNVAPTQPVLAIAADELGGRRGVWARWGLTAARGRLAINARAETVFTRPAFRDGIRGRRIAVLADGFFEWVRGPGGARRPRLIRPRDGSPLLFAAVAGRVETAAGPGYGCAVLTVPANADVEAVHDRMPLVLRAEDLDRWLDPELSEPTAIEPLLVSPRPGALEVIPVSSRVNKVEHDDPACLAPPDPEPEGEPSGGAGARAAGRGSPTPPALAGEASAGELFPAEIEARPARASARRSGARPRRARAQSGQLGFDFGGAEPPREPARQGESSRSTK